MVPVPVTLGPGESIDTHFVGGLSLKRRQVPKKYRKSTAVPVPVTGLGPGVSIDTHIVGALSLKKRKKRIFKKTGFPRSGCGFRNSGPSEDDLEVSRGL